MGTIVILIVSCAIVLLSQSLGKAMNIPYFWFLIGLIILVVVGYFIEIKLDIKRQMDELEKVRQQMQDLVNPDKMYERLGVDLISLQVGQGLLCIADPEQEGQLLAKVAAMRQRVTDKFGYILPNLRILDNYELNENTYEIYIRNNLVAKGIVYPNKIMVSAEEWDEKCGEIPENAIVGVDPISSTQCCFVDENVAEKYPDIKFLTAEDIIIQHIEKMSIEYVDCIITSCDVEKYIERVRAAQNSEKLIESINERLELETIRQVLVNLIREEVSIKDIMFVFERLCDYARFFQEADLLSERLRTALGRQICLKNVNEDNVLYVLELSEELENLLVTSSQRTEIGPMIFLNPDEIEDLIETTLKTLMRAYQSIGQYPVILCSPKIRLPLYQLLVRHIPTIVVISYSELITDIKVEVVDTIQLTFKDPETSSG
ncbi:MAG: FHIPEP family type III secretion protein [Candidatus Gastranaerophilaceae bacterium]